MQNFVGPGTPLTSAGIGQFTTATATGDAELWSVLSVETSGCGYLADMRPKILFERHIFAALTQHRYDQTHPDISQPTAGGYGEGGANQYNRLAEALNLDETAALQSASWGLGQIMGENYKLAGYGSVDAMVADMIASEDNQLAAVASFLNAKMLSTSLAQHDWTSFARGYNGQNYAENNYDGKLRQFYGLFTAGNMPDVTVRQVQMLLTYKGYDPGQIDGRMGTKTAGAISNFQADNGKPSTGKIDPGLIDDLS